MTNLSDSMKLYLLMIVLSEMTMPETVTSDEIEPIEMPWPPVHELPVNTMLEPLFYAKTLASVRHFKITMEGRTVVKQSS